MVIPVRGKSTILVGAALLAVALARPPTAAAQRSGGGGSSASESAGASPGRAPDVGAMNARAALLVDKLLRLTACLTEARSRAADAQLMVEQSARQAGDPSADHEVRRAAQATLRALEPRLERIERGAERCVQENGAGGFVLGEAPGPGVRYVDAAPTGAEARVARAAPSLQVFDEDAPLASGVRIVRGERVDGSGRADAAAVRSLVRGIGEEVRQCWDAWAARRSDPRGTAELVFTLSPGRGLRRVRVEGSTIRSAAFRRCLRAAGRRMGAASGVEGIAREGEVTVAYRLRFGGD